MRVLIACEESGVVRRAFEASGHKAWSNDLIPCSDGSRWHLQMDCLQAIDLFEWDLIIMHPPCTHLAVSGNRWYGRGTPGEQQRAEALRWTSNLWEKAKSVCSRVAMENPVGVLPHAIGPATQYIQPWEFGHPETKKTGLWLHGLPALVPTDVMPPPHANRVWRMPPGPDRQRLRSQTYQGIADAMASQWGELCYP